MTEFKYKEDQLLRTAELLSPSDPNKIAIESWFSNSPSFTSSNWGYVYYDKPSPLYTGFLCSNWANYRILGRVQYGGKAPHDEPVDTTDFSVEERSELVLAMELNGKVVECTKDDKDRVLILWGVVKPNDRPEKRRIGHVSVKPDGRDKWESKLSTSQFVILHDENAFVDWVEGGKLAQAAYYKKAK